MSPTSAVQFATPKRIHIGLPVQNLERSLRFYSALFGQAPTKTRPGYAKFEVADPPVNLSLNETQHQTGPNDPISHFGIQVKSTAAVESMARRFAELELQTRVEEGVTCCYAVQNKVWVADPDRNRWEIFVVLSDEGTRHRPDGAECCASDCCSETRAEPAGASTVPVACC
jgi:catechol 2,3-dioxygenase-like lactoylglutathione lyase family enzyme